MHRSTLMTLALWQVQKLPHAKIIATVPGKQHQIPIRRGVYILM